MPSKETSCTVCSHREICSVKSYYLNILKQIDEMEYTIGKDEKTWGVMHLSDSKDFSIELICRHHLKHVTYREKEVIPNYLQNAT
jgi:hypothetical protein